ncbi:hypothetical protein BJ508DRAFT_326810 [Ascobolus immersus RN42]|uniref:F-box domain-containing protein n=1 Tax=Ascobolus immersus RN42 TaxID=1160509 RepID=A0A3N4I4C9_ASCIM|nr:hypothetical protein BJ508DRAFT_326810 [Ascobolus immersus RN42]
MASIGKSSDPIVPFRLTDLPPELRLDFYEQCTAFTLLHLSHTNRMFRYEIISRPKIYANSPGFKDWKWAGEKYNPRAFALRSRFKLSDGVHYLKMSYISHITDGIERAYAEKLMMRYLWDATEESNLITAMRESPSSLDDTFELFDLPAELRLEIYDLCSAFSLLILTHVCRSFRYEILSRPKIYANSDGYAEAHKERAMKSNLRVRKLEPLVHGNALLMKYIDHISDPKERAYAEKLMENHIRGRNGDRLVFSSLGTCPSRFKCWSVCGRGGEKGCGFFRWEETRRKDVPYLQSHKCSRCELGIVKPLIRPRLPVPVYMFMQGT